MFVMFRRFWDIRLGGTSCPRGAPRPSRQLQDLQNPDIPSKMANIRNIRTIPYFIDYRHLWQSKRCFIYIYQYFNYYYYYPYLKKRSCVFNHLALFAPSICQNEHYEHYPLRRAYTYIDCHRPTAIDIERLIWYC